MIFVAWLLLSGPVIAQTSATAGLPASGVAASKNPGSAFAGRTLFMGTVRFKNGGPACSACHSVASLPFPQGGTLGPDLTRAYSKLGPEGLNSALETLFFPAMTPLFAYRPLTDDERRNLAAFFQDVDGQQPGTPTSAIGAIALATCLMHMGGVLPESLAARPGGSQHARRKLYRQLLLDDLRQRWNRHLGDAGYGLSETRSWSAGVRATRLPARHRLLLVHLQPAPDQVSIRPGSAPGCVARSAVQACGSGGSLDGDYGQCRGPPEISGCQGQGRLPENKLG